MEFELLGYKPEDKKRHEKTLAKLFPYLEREQFVLAGGNVIRFYAIKNGIDFPVRETDDIDIIIPKPEVLGSAAEKDFLVYHYHIYPEPTHEVFFDDRFYIVLVDPETKLKVDLFDYEPYTPHEPAKVRFLGTDILIRNLEDQLCTAVLEGSRVLSGLKQDPKHYYDIEVMAKLADKEKAERYWKDSRAKKPYATMKVTYQKMLEKRNTNPELFTAEKIRKGKKPYKCSYCADANGFHVTPMEEVFKVLGY